MFDPYAILGVAHDADAAAIRAAYRRRAKTIHPDRGGSAEAFRDLQRAHDILTDEVRRLRFDTTGDAGDENAANPDKAALDLINQMLVAILSGQNDPTKSDIVAEMIAGIDIAVLSMNERLGKLEQARVRCVAVRKRMKRKAPGPNAIAAMLDYQERQIVETRKQIEAQIAERERARELLLQYGYDWDRPTSTSSMLYGLAAPPGFYKWQPV